MNKEVLSDKQGTSLVVMFIIGETVAMQTASGSDLWIAVIFAIIIALLVSLVDARLLSLFSEEGLFDIIEHVFGKFFGKIICLLFVWYTLHIGAWVIRHLTEYPITTTLPETPIGVLIVFIIFLCVWGVKMGIEVLGRWAMYLNLVNHNNYLYNR